MDADVVRIRAHFDEFGAAEWDRLVDTVRGRVSFEIHRRMLTEFIRPGDRVLEVGAGPGRFTIALASLGTHITVTDISPVQLALNREKVDAAGCESAIDDRLLLDVRDIAKQRFAPFDVCVAYGGVLSYVFEDMPAALEGLLHAVRPGGVVLASVMATVGSARHFLPGIAPLLSEFGVEHVGFEIRTGDLRNTPGPHTCQMYRWRELSETLDSLGCRIRAVSASNCMSLSDEVVLAELEADPLVWRQFLEWEFDLCREPGALDSGTHILFAVEAH